MDLRVIRLKGAPCGRIVGDSCLGLGLEEGILGGGLIDHVGEPGVPTGVDMGTIQCVRSKWRAIGVEDSEVLPQRGLNERGGHLDVRVVIVLGVFNPASSDYVNTLDRGKVEKTNRIRENMGVRTRKFVGVFEELVAGKIGAYESTPFGIT